MSGSRNREYSYLRRVGQTMEATTFWGHKVQNWEDPVFAQRMKGRIFHMLEECPLIFTSVLTMAADAKKWDSMRKYLGHQPRIRIANPRRGLTPQLHVLLTSAAPEKHGRIKFDVSSFDSTEDVFKFLRQHLVADNPADIEDHNRPFNKYATNVEQLKLHQNKRDGTPSDWEVQPGSPRAYEEWAKGRGAETEMSDNKGFMIAKFPKGHDQFEFKFLPGWPSGNEMYPDESPIQGGDR